MPNNHYTVELLTPAIAGSKSWAEVCRKLDVTPATGAQTHLTKRARQLGIPSNHFVGKCWNKGKKFGDVHPISYYLIKGSNTKSHWLRNRLIKEKIKKKECERCKRTKWEELDIPLELHHLNEDHSDNRLENLQIVCPNCHAIIHARVA